MSAPEISGRATLERRLARLVRSDPILGSVRGAALRSGARVCVVGGLVRDAALGNVSRDVDLVADRGARGVVRLLAALWGRRGVRFRKRGITTWRVSIEGRGIDLVDADRHGIERDLARREFTVNALAYDVVQGRLLDPHRGLRDLASGVLRMPRPGVLLEDPVRALRAARFVATHPWMRLSAPLRREAKIAGRLLTRAAAERVRDEIDRLLLSSSPGRGLAEIEALGLLRSLLPELVPTRSCAAGLGRPDVWSHTISALEASSRLARRPGSKALRSDTEGLRVLRWSLALHDIAKPDTLKRDRDGRPTFHGHETLGSRRSEILLTRLKMPRSLTRRIVRVIAAHLRPHHLAEAGAPPAGMRRLVREMGEDLPVLLAHAACDAEGSGAPDAKRRWRRLSPVLRHLETLHTREQETPAPLLLDGRRIMAALSVPEGPRVGALLRRLRELQDEGVVNTPEEAIRALRSEEV